MDTWKKSQLESNDDADKETPEINVARDKENSDLHVDTKKVEKQDKENDDLHVATKKTEKEDKENGDLRVASKNAEKEDEENGDLHVASKKAEKEEEVAVDCQKNKQDDERVVTLRRQNISLDNSSTFTEDDYNFSNFVLDPHGFRSRKKTEIGSERMISCDDLRLAATLVHDAMEGRTVDFKREPKYVRSYNLYKSWQLTYLLYLATFINISLVLFEKPALPSLELPNWVTMSLEFLCIVYFTIRTCHHAHWRGARPFFRDLKNIFVIGILILTILDMFVFIILTNVFSNYQHVRYSRVLRAVLIVSLSDGRQIYNLAKKLYLVIHLLLNHIILTRCTECEVVEAVSF